MARRALSAPDQRPLWTCPACGERFVSARLWHSCGRHSYDALFARSEPHVREIFEKLAGLARACGPVRIYPQKTRVVIQARIRFAGGSPQKRVFVAGFLLRNGLTSPRFSKVIDGVSAHYAAYYVPLRSVNEVDAQVARWMRQAYRFGIQEHLQGDRRPRKAARGEPLDPQAPKPRAEPHALDRLRPRRNAHRFAPRPRRERK